ncbi:MAG: sigma 54-interacting transcriptional regulator [Deltaproteobacteria bacterium]|nr:sigma 54-interacting transcriptional regulator [Deltaproteobacteria bacterium]
MTRARKDNVTSLLDDVPPFTRQRGGLLKVMKGPDRGESVVLGQEPVVIGSSPSCTFVLTDKTVSRQHIQAQWENGGVLLKDLGSTNGTFYEGSRFKEITIDYGGEFKLGRTVIKFFPEEEVVEPEVSPSENFGSLVGQDAKMRRLFALLSDISPTDATVIIEGETGTGKELVAEEIHRHSPRKDGPFVVFDCGAVPRDLIESALFGHVKGSFTGAVADRRGAFAEAHGGTIFLDEIGELSMDLQPALLRVLDKRAVRRVGGNQYERVDVRVVAATNRDLREEVARKNFREDLYYRLAVIRITLPPLRERGNDIPYLIDHFVRHFSPKGGPLLRVTPDDMGRLQRHGWQGNVRELRNVTERACVLSRGDTINLDDALMEENAPALGIRTDLPFKEAKGQLVEIFEREYIVDLMRRHKMNLSSAAREAQIDRKHLRELIRKYGLDAKEID